MYQYTKEQVYELKEYKKVFPELIEIEIMYQLVTKTLAGEGLKRNIISDIAVNYGVSENTLYYWQKKYQKDGVIGILNKKDIVKRYLQESNKPLIYWNKRLLQDTLKQGITIKEKELVMNVSLTTCWNILNELEYKCIEENRTEDLNDLSKKMRKEFIECSIFIDYFIVPEERKTLYNRKKYCFIILANNSLSISANEIDKRTRTKYEDDILKVFDQLIRYLKEREELDEDSILILPENKRNILVKECYNMLHKSNTVIVGDIEKLDLTLQKKFKQIEIVKEDLLLNVHRIKDRAYIDKLEMKINRTESQTT